MIYHLSYAFKVSPMYEKSIFLLKISLFFNWFVTCLLACNSKSVLATYGWFCGSGSHFQSYTVRKIIAGCWLNHLDQFVLSTIFWKGFEPQFFFSSQWIFMMCHSIHKFYHDYSNSVMQNPPAMGKSNLDRL